MEAEAYGPVLRAGAAASRGDFGDSEPQRAAAGEERACMLKGKPPSLYLILFLVAFLTGRELLCAIVRYQCRHWWGLLRCQYRVKGDEY